MSHVEATFSLFFPSQRTAATRAAKAMNIRLHRKTKTSLPKFENK